MDYRRRRIAETKVGPLCLGAMIFDQIGNNDHHDSVRITHRALDAGIHPIDTAVVDDIGAWMSANEADA